MPSLNLPDFGRETPVFPASPHEEIVLLESLRGLVSSGDQRLDLVLAAIADVARRLTGASGAALAMWKDGMMVCRARSGDSVPPLGTQLSAETGISGECLRTGDAQVCSDTENNQLVDVEVCRRLGWRSIAVLPIHGWRGINGILEVVSSEPVAFSEHQITVLKELAALAERARSSQPHGASQFPAGERVKEQPEEWDIRTKRSALLPASDRVGDVALAAVGGRSRRFVLGAAGVVAVALIVLAIWLGWRGDDQSENNARASASSSIATTVTAHPSETHLPDNDPVWKPNPGGETLFTSNGKPAVGSPVKLASKSDVIEISTVAVERTPVTGGATKAAKAGPPSGSEHSSSLTVANSEKSGAPEPPALTAEAVGVSALPGALGSHAMPMPVLVAPLSQGISGGQLLHGSPPVYPARARALRLEGKVILNATVNEDGSVTALKVVQGHPTLAESAVDAVKQWRYKPFLLDGKPIKRETTITFDFKN